jgi:hypothetical protein
VSWDWEADRGWQAEGVSDGDPHDVPGVDRLQGHATLGLATQLARELTDVADVGIERLHSGLSVTITPANPRARAFGWADFSDSEEIFLQVGEYGGRWELRPVPEDLTFLADVAWSVIAGRVREIFARGRSLVTVTMPDGSVETEVGHEGLTGCLPLPFWRRWSRSVQYAPYR